MMRRRQKHPKVPDMTERCLGHIAAMQAAIDFRQVGSLGDLCLLIARQRQRSILIHSGSLPSYITGVWTEVDDPVTGEQYDLILVTTTAPPDEQEHIILHELSHMWCGHAAEACGDQEITSLLRFHTAEAPVMLSLHCRSRMDTDIEREAETLATLLADLLHQQSHAGPLILDAGIVSDDPDRLRGIVAALKELPLSIDEG